MSAAEYIHGRLLETLRADVPVATIQDVLDNNKLIVFTAPKGHTLHTSEKNDFQIAANDQEVRSLTAGYNWDTATVASGAVLLGKYR